MLTAGEFSAAAAFSGAAVLPTQPPPSPSSPASKTRAAQRVLPLTVKQLTSAFSSPSSATAAPDGNVRILGIVVDRADRPTDVTFTLHDGTGRIVLTRWVNEATDAEELAPVRNGVYVMATCNLKGFRAKGLAVAFNISIVMKNRPGIFLSPCAAHCIDLMLEDMGKESKFEELIRKCQKLTGFIYNHSWALQLMRAELGRELIRPGITRFATHFLALDSILKHKEGLKKMFRLVTDFNIVALHFFECIYVHLENRRKEHGFHPNSHTDLTINTPSPYRAKGYQVPLSNQFVSHPAMDASRNDIYMLVLEAFLEPASLVRENGLHVNEVVRRLGIPVNTVMDAISYHVDVGNIYSTIDEHHFKSARNG